MPKRTFAFNFLLLFAFTVVNELAAQEREPYNAANHNTARIARQHRRIDIPDNWEKIPYILQTYK